MARIFFSLIVKKYSLKPVKYQIAIQSGMLSYHPPTKQVLFSCQSWFHLFIQPITNLVMIILLSY